VPGDPDLSADPGAAQATAIDRVDEKAGFVGDGINDALPTT
jgi:hypothetical protein